MLLNRFTAEKEFEKWLNFANENEKLEVARLIINFLEKKFKYDLIHVNLIDEMKNAMESLILEIGESDIL